MQSFRFTPPQRVPITHACQLSIKPVAGMSDLLLLEATNAAICECIVAAAADSAPSANHFSVAIRLHPCFSLAVDAIDVDGANVSVHQSLSIGRTMGQGCRLYQALRVSKTACIADLKRGVTIVVLPQTDGLRFAINAPLLDLVPLEQDCYLHSEPEVVNHAKAVLNHPFDYTAAPNQLLLELSELVQVSEQLSTFAVQTSLQQVPNLMQTLSKLQQQVEAKRQLLYRHYCTAVERVNLAQSANSAFSSLDAQRLAMYQMLASDELTTLVNSMVGDELKTVITE